MTKRILSCDWGTSSFRLRLVSLENNSVIAETTGNNGIASVYNEWLQSNYAEKYRMDFYKTLLQSEVKKLTAGSLDEVPMIISGMASSSIGIKELPYVELPLPVNGDSLHIIKIPPDEKCNHEILLVSGLRTTNDAMRGEETMLVGCNIRDDAEQLIIFPGTHSKHAVVKNKVLLDFSSYMTGEVFELLANKSILSKSIIKDESNLYNDIFKQGVKEGASGNLLNVIFHVRTRRLYRTITPEENYHYLSGLLIGCELKQIPEVTVKIQLVCGQELLDLYQLALETLSNTGNIQYTDAGTALIDGHCKLSRHFL